MPRCLSLLGLSALLPAQSYPNVEPPTNPFFAKWVAVSSKLMVRLSPAAYARHSATNSTSIACRVTFTGKDAAHAAVTKTANISLRYSRDLCWPPTKAKMAAQQPCGGAMHRCPSVLGCTCSRSADLTVRG